jgi:hypothetical protein
MSEWIDFSRWDECTPLERPGYVFEVVNADAQSLLTDCTLVLPVPFDWLSPPARFRLVPTPPLRRSDPMPPQADRD